jgi:3-hydroxyisobutyrate dehydrogenase-like beta-hydroxyacid dehydrogenase
MKAGIVGLGNMGSALAGNLVGVGLDVITHDAAGDARNPDGAAFTDELGDLARQADVVVLSLPNGSISRTVATGIAATNGRATTAVVDTSTVGVAAARAIGAALAASGIEYVDAPVSGGPAGARTRTLAIMYAATDSALERTDAVLRGLSDRLYRVGDQPGLGQVIKLANNFLSATALTAASEAVAFGVAEGVEMGTMLEVLNAASGRSAATEDKFVNHVLTEKYSSGFANTLMTKDLRLYLEAVAIADAPARLGRLTVDTWERFAAAEPEVDFTRIYPFVAGG